MTNYEKIVSEMSHGRLAEMLEHEDFCCESYDFIEGFECTAPDDMDCNTCIRKWLKQEAEK